MARYIWGSFIVAIITIVTSILVVGGCHVGLVLL